MNLLPIAIRERELTDAEAKAISYTMMTYTRVNGQEIGRRPTIQEIKASTKITTHVRDRLTGEWHSVDGCKLPMMTVRVQR